MGNTSKGKEQEMKRKVAGKIMLIVVFVTAFWFSSKPVGISRYQSDRILIELKIITQNDLEKRTSKYKFWRNRIRKVAHFGLFAVAGMVAYLVTGSLKRSILVTLVMGSADEIHQYFIPGRGAQIRDVMIDTFGGAVGAVFMMGVLNLKNKKTKFFLRV